MFYLKFNVEIEISGKKNYFMNLKVKTIKINKFSIEIEIIDDMKHPNFFGRPDMCFRETSDGLKIKTNY